MKAIRRSAVRLNIISILVSAAFMMQAMLRADEVTSSRAKHLFKNPPKEYSTGPLWVWNDLLGDEEIRSTLRDLAGQEIKQVWVHPRPGLMTPYLTGDWFHFWKVALDEAKKLDMDVWIYDENSYPSGFAGGWVPELMPESRGRGLVFRETTTAPKLAPEILGVYRIDKDACENLTPNLRGTGSLVVTGA